MKIAIMQPYLFPYIGYWQLINAVDTFVLLDDVNFIKGGWINRNYILIDNKPHLITLSLDHASPNKLIYDIEINQKLNNKRKILNTLKMSYSKAPEYEKVYPLLETIINNEEKNLSEYIEFSIRLLCDYLRIPTKIINSSSLNKDDSKKAQDRVIEICKVLNAKTYINSFGGIDLYDRQTFQKNEIELKFIKPKAFKYEQFNSEFVASLSIIDIMMFNKVNKISDFLRNYEFIEKN